jgi:hypothetical protein
MIAGVRRIAELIRPGAEPAADPRQTLPVDLLVATIGLCLFGVAIAAHGGLGWRLFVVGKVALAFLLAFVLALAPLYSLKRFFEVEIAFGKIVGELARHLAIGGIFAASFAGLFWLVRRGDPAFDGALTLGFVALILVAVLFFRARAGVRWLPPFPALLAVALFLGMLAQSAWALRPYMDPRAPTLFEAKAEWFGGPGRAQLEDTIRRLGSSPPR